MTADSKFDIFKKGFIGGLGWAFGVTIGFVVISILIAVFFSRLGGLPLIGNWIADLVAETENQLRYRTPVFR